MKECQRNEVGIDFKPDSISLYRDDSHKTNFIKQARDLIPRDW